PIWSLDAYKNAWRQWGREVSEKPKDYDQAFRERYGLHPAPYANGIYPMGLREGQGLLAKGLSADCMLCHAGSILGKSYVGLGNASLDAQALFEELSRADGRPGKTPHVFSHVRGTSEAATMSVFLLGLRTPELKLRLPRLDLG